MLPDGSGYVYGLNPSGQLRTLLTFPAKSFQGSPAYVPLLQAADGNLYGATTSGGEQGAGAIYKLSLDGRYTSLHIFPRSRVSFSPVALIEASDGNLYGATLGVESQLFRVTTSGQYTLLYTMNMYTDGRCPCQLIQGSDGKIYGSAMLGGTAGFGNIFAWSAGLAKAKPSAARFQPESGAGGHRGPDLGRKPAFRHGEVQRSPGGASVRPRSELHSGHCPVRRHPRTD